MATAPEPIKAQNGNASFPEPPPLDYERPPLVKTSLLDVSPVAQRLENLDAMRILCMAVIIITHVTEPYLDAVHKRAGQFSSPLTLAVLAINVMGRFGVPCFMMISFYIYWHQLYEKGRSWGELLVRRFKRLIPAFLVWSAVYFLIHRSLYRGIRVHGHQVLYSFWNSAFFTELNRFGYSLANWRTWRAIMLGQAEHHLYYLPLVLQCLICIPLLRLLWKRPIVSWLWIGGTAAVWGLMVYGPVMFAPGSKGAHLTATITRYTNQPWAIPFLLFPLFGMMCAGQLVWRHFIAKTPTWLWVGLLIFSLGLHAAEAIFLAHRIPDDLLRIAVFMKMGRILSGIAVFVLFIRHPLMKDPWPKVSHYAFGLHFMHPAIITALLLAETKFLGPQYFRWEVTAAVVPMLAVNLLLTFTITFCLCLLVGRFKKLEFLVV